MSVHFHLLPAYNSISGLRADNFTPENLIRSALEGIAGELYGYYRSIQSATGIHANKIIASGNALRRSPLLREICSSMFSMPVELTDNLEEAACGAAMSSMKGIQISAGDRPHGT